MLHPYFRAACVLAIASAPCAAGTIDADQKISDVAGDFAGVLDDRDNFGSAIADVGDLDGDGQNDVAVGVVWDDDGASNAGAVWILFLNADGTVRDEQKISATDGGFTGPLDANDEFGAALAAIDLDDDGDLELAVGAPGDDDDGADRGAVWILDLDTDGTVLDEQKISSLAGGFAGPLTDGDAFGSALSCLGDLDDDTVDDLGVGAKFDDDGGESRGAFWVLFMNDDGTVDSHVKVSSTSGGLSRTLDDHDLFGASAACLGDLDGNGTTEVAVGAIGDDDGTRDAGAVWILSLTDAGLVDAAVKISETSGGFSGSLDFQDRFASSLAAVGDVNCDDIPDLACGAEQDDDGGTNQGAFYVLFLNTDGTVAGHQKISATAGGFAGDLDPVDFFGCAIAAVGPLEGRVAVGARGDDDGGNQRGAVWVLRTLDDSIPSITLLGDDPLVIDCGNAYVEPGATATDLCDGDITGSIVIDDSAVDTSAVGTYSVFYDVTDAAGNTAPQVTRTVEVVDTVAPVLTLLGDNPQTLECNATYLDPGAMAIDACEGDISGSIIVDSSDVNIGVVGSYTVFYDVMDSSGNVADQVSRTVEIVDTLVPSITLIGDDPQTVECTEAYIEQGATAADLCTGDLTGDIVIDASAVDTNTPGTYPVTYDVMDPSGNPAPTVTRMVEVVDTTPPTITLLGDDPQEIACGSPYVELGATALDTCDGDITGSIVADASGVDTGTPGSYTVFYDVMDAAGNPAATVMRAVNVTDDDGPAITLIGNDPQIVECGTGYAEQSATVIDACEGDISGNLVIDDSNIDLGTLGSYTVFYDAMDSSGNAATTATRTVEIVDTLQPTITLTGDNPQTIECGESYTELGATATDSCDGNLTGSIVIDATGVDTTAPGSYTVFYDVMDSGSNAATTVMRTVEVVDSAGPVISLTGDNRQIIECGSTYTELGATAIDACEGDVSGNLVIDDSDVTADLVGNYTVFYDATDGAGNPAAQVERDVEVVDTTGPVITLLGDDPQMLQCGDAYGELGATADDVCEGDVSGNVIIDASSVNAAVPGTYMVQYDAMDGAGNPATTVFREVQVVDGAIPVITLTGMDPQTVQCGGTYVEMGATVDDACEGDISGNLVINASGIDENAVGSYTVFYNAMDSSGNAAVQVERTVEVVDNEPPVITLVGSDPQIQQCGLLYVKLGATALDACEGDLTNSIIEDATGVITSVLGDYTVFYDVMDSSGNPAVTVMRTVTVVDTLPPDLDLLGDNPQIIECGDPYIEQNAMAADDCEGDLFGSIVIDDSDVDTGTPGSYIVTYDVMDSQGLMATQAVRMVMVVDTTAPTITVLGDNPQTVECGGVYSESGATADDDCDGDLSGDIVIDDSAVDESTPGSYTVFYDVMDSTGNPATTAMRTVEVVDTTAPVISLVGADPQTINCGDSYVELGATVTDDCDDGVTVMIDASAVDTGTIGTYPVTYDATDASSNDATQVTRMVDVVDSGPPTVTCPADISVKCDAGGCTADVTWTPATASDGCFGDISGDVLYDIDENDDGIDVADQVANSYEFPVGTHRVIARAIDGDGMTGMCSFLVEVLDVNALQVTVELHGVWGVGLTCTRCITFELVDCGGAVMETVEAPIEFTSSGMGDSATGNATIDVPCGTYDCITARDALHTTRRADQDDFGIVGTQYVADFTNQSAGGGDDDALISGDLNDDDEINFDDYLEWAGEDGSSYGTPDTTCLDPMPHADLNCSGTVDLADLTFIHVNYLKVAEDDCCTLIATADRNDRSAPRTDVSMAELGATGLGHLAAADVNLDGWIDAIDIALTMTGVLPDHAIARYVGPAGGSWHEPSNWSTGSVPDATTDVLLHGSVVVIDQARARSIVVGDGGDLLAEALLHAETAVTVLTGGGLVAGDGATIRADLLTIDEGGLLVVNGGELDVEESSWNAEDAFFVPQRSTR